MEGAVFVIVAIGFVVVAGLVAYANHLAAQRRREGMARLASARGWTYVERDDSWVNRFHDAPFGIGFSQKAVNVVRGEHDHRKFVAFDYWYSTREGSGKSRRTVRHVCSVIAITTTGVLPDLRVMPENMFSRLVTRITNSDIELESEQFNRAFTITCDDRKFATDVLHPPDDGAAADDARPGLEPAERDPAGGLRG